MRAWIVLRECSQEALQHMPYCMRSDFRRICRRIATIRAESTIKECIYRLARWYIRRWFSDDRGNQVQRSIGWHVIGEAHLIWLIHVQNVGASIPSPVVRLCTQLVLTYLHHTTRPILLKQADHAAASRSTIDVYCKRSCT